MAPATIADGTLPTLIQPANSSSEMNNRAVRRPAVVNEERHLCLTHK